MPNRAAHLFAGVATGAARAAFLARSQRRDHLVAETIGGALSGALGSSLPDWIEPAIHPNHRRFAHSWATGFAVGLGADWVFRQGAIECRSLADRCGAHADAALNDVAAFLWRLAEYALRAVAGACNALAPGYVSHLVLDAMTEKSIPLFGLG